MSYEEFIKKYRFEHYFCPKCHTSNYSSTLVGYAYDTEHPEKYQDRNLVTCQICGWKGISHDLIPKTPKTAWKICYTDYNGLATPLEGTIDNRDMAKRLAKSYDDDAQKAGQHRYYYSYEVEIK